MKTGNTLFHTLLALGAAAVLFTFCSLAQVTLQAGVGGGAIVPAADYAGTTAEYFSGEKYGFSTGFTAHGKVRIGLLGFKLAGEVSYSSFSNDGEAEPGQGTVEISHKILSFKLGPEFHLGLPLMPVRPYFGAHAALNRFSGETVFQGVSRVSSGTYSFEGASRIGVGFTGGVIVKMGTFSSLDVAVTYSLMNLGGRTWEDANPAQDQRLDSYLALNDEKDPLYASGNDRHFVGSSRSINSIQLTATLMFGL